LKIEGGSSLASNIDSQSLTVENTVINVEITLEEKSDDINVKNELIEEVHMYIYIIVLRVNMCIYEYLSLSMDV
jgi:hypothetical protein